MNWRVLCRVFCAVLSGTVVTMSMAEATYTLNGVIDAYNAGHYAEAIPGLKALSSAGDVTAQSLWCEANAMGLGVARQTSPIPACYEAAKAGAPRALGVVAQSLLQNGNQEQKLQAAALAQRGADAGDRRSMLLAGQAYFFGDIPRDPAKAAHYFRLAMSQGDTAAEKYLGYMYAKGEGVTQNVSQGLVMLDSASRKGDVDATRVLGVLYARGEVVPKDLNKAVHYFARASQSGDAIGSYELYNLYASASNWAQLVPQANQALQQAVAGGYGQAEAEYGIRLLDVAKTQGERDQAKKFLRAANNKGVPEGSLNYALAMLSDAQPDYRQAAPILEHLIGTLPNTDVGLRAGVAMAWMIAHDHAAGGSRDVEYLLGQAERSQNPVVARMARTTREQIARYEAAREQQDEQVQAQANPAAALFAGLLLLGLSSSSSSNSSSASDEAVPEFDGAEATNRRTQCILESHLCVEDCTYANTEAAGQCRMSCPNTCY
jgi:TPR repeat protein